MSQKNIKLILLGDEKVGKSSLFEKFINDKFSSSYNPTKSIQNKRQNIKINGETIPFQLIDSTGNEQWHKDFNISIYPNTNSIIILFDLTNKTTLDNVFKKWIPFFFSALKISPIDNFPVIILGNFSDLGTKKQIPKQEIQNTLKEILKYTTYYYYQEISIKKEKVINLFNKIVLFILARPPPSPEKPKIEGDDKLRIDDLKDKIKQLEEERKRNEENHKVNIKSMEEKIQMLEKIKALLTENGKKDQEEKDKLNGTIKILMEEKQKLTEELSKNQIKNNNENSTKTKVEENMKKEINMMNDRIKVLEEQKKILMEDINSKNQIEKKYNEEVDKFNKENQGIFRDNFQKNIDNESQKFLNDINGINKDKYKKSYYLFFQDLDEFKEKMEKSCPYFKGKNEILFDKIIDLNKKFFEINFMGNKEEIEEEIKNLKNENLLLNQKLNEANEELFKLKQNNGEQFNKLNTDLISEKMKNKNLEDKINILLHEKKIIQDSSDQKFEKMENDYKNKISEIINLKNQNESDLRVKEKEIDVLKLNNEKINSLHELKFKNFEKEILNWKDKYNNLTKENKNKEENLIKEIETLKTKNEKLKNDKKFLEKNNNDLINQDMKNLLKNFKESSEKNIQLNNLLTKSENKINNLEEQINNLSIYKSITDNIKEVICKKCQEIFNIEDFKEHYKNCTNESKSRINNNENIFNPEKLKLKILKAKVKQDEIGKPYLDYIIDIKYNEQNWRINKKFNQFITLYKAIKNLYQNIIEIPESGNIFLNINDIAFNNFHESKIHQLEKFLNDLIEIEHVNTSKPFLKFLEFDKYYDKDTDNYLNNSQSIFNQGNSLYSLRKPVSKNENNISYDIIDGKSNSFRNNYKNQYD